MRWAVAQLTILALAGCAGTPPPPSEEVTSFDELPGNTFAVLVDRHWEASWEDLAYPPHPFEAEYEEVPAEARWQVCLTGDLGGVTLTALAAERHPEDFSSAGTLVDRSATTAGYDLMAAGASARLNLSAGTDALSVELNVMRSGTPNRQSLLGILARP